MISKLKLILLTCMVLLAAAFVTWVYSLSARLESEKQKREAAEAAIAVLESRQKQAQIIANEQSQLAEENEIIITTLHAQLQYIYEEGNQNENTQPIPCDTPAVITGTIERLYP